MADVWIQIKRLPAKVAIPIFACFYLFVSKPSYTVARPVFYIFSPLSV